MDHFRKQSERFGTQIFTETVSKVDFSTRPFRVFTGSKTVEAESVVVATGAVAKRLPFPGSGDCPNGYWNFGISASMGSTAAEKTENELRKEIDELQRQQGEITERLRVCQRGFVRLFTMTIDPFQLGKNY